MRKWIALVGYSLLALIMVGLLTQVLLALRNNQPFYGRNAWGLALGTYSTLALMGIAGIIGSVRLTQILVRRRRRR